MLYYTVNISDLTDILMYCNYTVATDSTYCVLT